MATDSSVAPAPTAPVDTTTQYLSNPTRIDANGNAYNTTYLNPNYKDPSASTQPVSSVGIVTSNQSQTNFNQQGSDATTARNAQIAALQKQIADTQAKADAATKLGYGANDQIKTDSSGNMVAKDASTTNPDGSVTGADGSTTLYDTNGQPHTFPVGTDLVYAKTQMEQADSAISNVTSDQATYNKLLQYDVNTDPDAVAAAKSISDSFDILIKQMTDKNSMLIGGIRTNAARSGSLQYANDMSTMYDNAEVAAGIQRISTLQSQERDAIYKSNQAYNSGNVKALDQASKDLEQAKKDSRQAILDVQKTINDQIKSNADQAKIDAADAKTQNTQDITNSKAVAQATLDAIKSSGITDQTQIDSLLKEVADANGISNPSILQGQIATLDPQYGTAALKNANTASVIANRNKPKTPKVVVDKVAAGFQKDAGAQITAMNTTTATGTTKTGWSNAYNTLAQKYAGLGYKLSDGTVVKVTDKLTPDQVTMAGGDPANGDQTIIDIALDKKDNYKKVANQ